MNKVIIATDSTCDLSAELVKQYNIEIVPLYVNFDEKAYHDGVEMTADMMYTEIEKTKIFPKTSATSPKDFVDFFRPFIESGCDIVYTGISSKMSSTFQNAHIARDEFPENRIYLVDSGNLSTGIGLLLLKASTWRSAGMSAAEIAKKVEETTPKVRSQFVIEAMDYLYRGGRCSGLTRLLGATLHIKPMIAVTNASMVVAKKTIGPMKKALNVMVEDMIKQLQDVDPEFLFVTHSQGYKNYQHVMTKLGPVKSYFTNIMQTQAGCVIASHCGKGTIGILYIMK